MAVSDTRRARRTMSRIVQTLTSLNSVLPVILGVLGPVEGIVAAAGDSGQAFVDAPAVVTGALINGYTTVVCWRRV